MHTVEPDPRDAPTLGYTYAYPRPAVTVDVALFTFDEGVLQILLIRRKNPPFTGAWALPGGFVDMHENLEDAAWRELAEETNITDVQLEQLHAFGEPDRDPRGRTITITYLALLRYDQLVRTAVRGGDDAVDAAWCNVQDLPELAFDHNDIIGCALQRLRDGIESAHYARRLLPEEFTLSDLQNLYEAVLTESLDRRNFRRGTLKSGSLEATGRFRKGKHRPARLYRFL